LNMPVPKIIDQLNKKIGVLKIKKQTQVDEHTERKYKIPALFRFGLIKPVG
jgi:hypothetical protein